jgi:hypothetical protein
MGKREPGDDSQPAQSAKVRHIWRNGFPVRKDMTVMAR